MLNDIKEILGIYHDRLDMQIDMYIEAGKKDLEMAGIVPALILETDPLIYSALVSFTLSMIDTYDYRELSANAYALQKDQLRHYKEYRVG